MQRVWAPWREGYITRVIHNKHRGCIFCRILKSNQDAKHYIFLRTPLAFAVLNIYPYSNGHCLILSNRHVNDISRLKFNEIQAMMELLLETKKLLEKVLCPHGFNIGFNVGRIAGAGIPGHVHIHLVPRWQGDHNFMPVTAGTKVISQSLKKIYQLLTNTHAKQTRHRRA